MKQNQYRCVRFAGLFLFLAVFLPISGFCQTFLNLNFEQANPIFIAPPSFFVTAASALPNWTISYNGASQTEMTYNVESTGESWVSLVGPELGGVAPFAAPLNGNYSAFLEGGGLVGASISQTGTIPSGIQSLFFDAEFDTPGTGVLELMLGGESIPFSTYQTEPTYTVYAANISAWEGQNEQLTFFAPAISGGLNGWLIDNVQFSQTAVTPEPSPLILAGIGVIVFVLQLRFEQTHRKINPH